MDIKTQTELNFAPPGCTTENWPMDYENFRLETVVFIEGDDLKNLKSLVRKAKKGKEGAACVCLEISLRATIQNILEILAFQANKSTLLLRITDTNE